MNRSVIVGVAAMLLTTATALAQPALPTPPATNPARSPPFSRHSIDKFTPSPPKISVPWPRCRRPMA